jgi:hypothetical protein
MAATNPRLNASAGISLRPGAADCQALAAACLRIRARKTWIKCKLATFAEGRGLGGLSDRADRAAMTDRAD